MLLGTLLYQQKPFLVLDWKKNYRALLKTKFGDQIQVYTVGRDVAPFRFNPLIPPPGAEPSSWVKKLIEILSHATYVGEGVMFILQNALEKLYRRFRIYPPSMFSYTLSLSRVIVDQVESYQVRIPRAPHFSSALHSFFHAGGFLPGYHLNHRHSMVT